MPQYIASRPTTPIGSRNHPLILRIRRLREHSERARTGFFYVEGLRFVATALQEHFKLHTLVVCHELLDHPLSKRILSEQKRRGAFILVVTPDVFLSLTYSDEPQGIGAVLQQRWHDLSHLKAHEELCWLAHQQVRSLGNLGTILRTSMAVGGAGLILLDEETDPYDPALVRASMGAIFKQRLMRTTATQLHHWCQREQIPIVGTSPHATHDYQQIRYQRPTLLLMGEERRGLTPELQRLCEIVVRIPMTGKIDSLNLAVATGILLYEVFNQHRALPMP